MLIQNVHIKNFRSIFDESLSCDSLTALVGRNGSGKSSFLVALDLFYNPTAQVTPEDFYDEDVSQDIEITVTYSDLSAEARGLFARYIENDTLTALRVFTDPQSVKSGTYHGLRLQNPDFVCIRDAESATEVRRRYNAVRQADKYASLPTVTSAEAAKRELDEWETQNPQECRRLREKEQFFGFTQVAQGYLGRYTKFIHVPAVRDALEDATDKRGSAVTEIMDLVVRSALAKRKDVEAFRQSTQNQYREIMDPNKLHELGDLARDLSKTLQSFVPEAEVLLQWSELSDISVPMPQAEVKLLEDEYENHGSQ